MEQEVSPRRNVEIEPVLLISTLFFRIFTRILLKLFFFRNYLGVFELIHSSSLILFCVIFWEFTVS